MCTCFQYHSWVNSNLISAILILQLWPKFKLRTLLTSPDCGVLYKSDKEIKMTNLIHVNLPPTVCHENICIAPQILGIVPFFTL